jgi:hypothetical protein
MPFPEGGMGVGQAEITMTTNPWVLFLFSSLAPPRVSKCFLTILTHARLIFKLFPNTF